MNLNEKLTALGVGNEALSFAKTLRVNAFNKQGYQVDVGYGGMARFKNFLEDYTLQSDLKKAVPQFQRNNDKWTLEQKQGFILNALKGVDSTILLATYNKGYRHYIIDGYQRATAIYQFIDGVFSLANGINYDYIVKNNLYKVASFKVRLKVYDFSTIRESVEFYIDMNENITHSIEDIKKAKDYLRGLKENKDA